MVELLQGIRIVEAASFIAAPLCGLTFQQLGADVIRIDPIGGGPVRPAPRLGAHTNEILTGVLGLPESEIRRLYDAGLVASAGEALPERSN